MTHFDAAAFRRSLADKSPEELDALLRQYYQYDVLPVERIKATCAAVRDRRQAPVPDPAKRFARFMEDYTQDPTPIYDDAVTQDEIRADRTLRRSRTRRRVRSVQAAVLAAVLLTGLLSLTAFGQELGQSIVTWIQETFAAPKGSGYMDFPTLEAALKQYGVETPLAPSYIPEGFELTTMNVDLETGLIHFFAEYSGSSGAFSIQIQKHVNGSPFTLTVDDDAVLYTVGGVDHYLTSSGSISTCVWTDDDCHITLTGSLTWEQIQTVVASIYTDLTPIPDSD